MICERASAEVSAWDAPSMRPVKERDCGVAGVVCDRSVSVYGEEDGQCIGI